MVEERLQRVHVVGVRSQKDRFVVVLSDPEFDLDGNALRADTWEIPWDSWVAAGGKVDRL